MAMMLFVLLMAYVVQNGVVDALEAGHGRTPARWVAAQKRADARIAKATARSHRYQRRAAKYQAKTGRPPRRSTVRPYLRALWHDGVEDVHARHDRRRADRQAKAAAVAGPVIDRPDRVDRPDGAPGPDVKPRTRPAEQTGQDATQDGWTMRFTWPDGVRTGPGDLNHPAGIAIWDQDDLDARTAAAEAAVARGELASYQVEPHRPDTEHTPEEDDGDQLATVTPISEGITPMTAPTAEVTGIRSAMDFAEQTATNADEAITTVERLAAFFDSNEMPDSAAKARQLMEQFGQVSTVCNDIRDELEPLLGVRDQWAAAGNQGTKEAIVNE